MTKYYCYDCKKQYSCYQSFWEHNKHFHKLNQKINQNTNQNINEIINQVISPEIINQVISPEIINSNQNLISNLNQDIDPELNLKKKYKCKYCNKIYSHYQSKYRHQNICSNLDKHKIIAQNNESSNNASSNSQSSSSNQIILPNIEDQILNILDNINITPKIIEKINTIKNNNNNTNTINSNNNNNNNITNNIIINKVGYEDIYELTEEEVKAVLNNIYESISKIVEVINFNERLPQNHSFCSTALNSPYISVYDKLTNKVNKEKKAHLFRDLIDTSIIKIKEIFNNNKKKMKEKQKKQIEEEIKEYMDVKKIITNDKYKKNIYSSINLTSYNKKNVVLDTWDKVKNSSIEIEKERTFEDDLKEMFMLEKKRILYGLEPKNNFKNKINNSDDDSNQSDNESNVSISSCELDKVLAKLNNLNKKVN